VRDQYRNISELVVISGKGGTGKTSLTASLAALAHGPVIADCDVDAADLHLVLKPRVLKSHEFVSGNEARVRTEDCTCCGVCREVCRFGAVQDKGTHPKDRQYAIDPIACEGCGVCVRFCPVQAIDFPERTCGQWMISETSLGPMVHARLGVAAENSGKLVTLVRREARRIAEEQGKSLIIVDGPPGIGCPVIASLSGASLALVVTEPTVSGNHDLERVLSLTGHFGVPAAVCVNKWDLNPDMTRRIEEQVLASGASLAGRIRYDGNVTRAQLLMRPVVEMDTDSSRDIREIWKNLHLVKE
jgi:MinD superfamily P-loop ATPase